MTINIHSIIYIILTWHKLAQPITNNTIIIKIMSKTNINNISTFLLAK